MNILDIKSQILSDVPCTLFITIYLVLRNNKRFSPKRIILLILSALMAILTRSQVLLLLLAEAAYLCLTIITAYRSGNKLSFKDIYNSVSIKVIMGVTLINLLLTSTIFATPKSTVGYYNGFFNYGDKGLWALIGYNINYLLLLFKSTFHFNTNDQFWQGPITIMEYAGIIFLVSGFILSMRKKKVRVDDIFFCFICCLIIFLPVYQGYRFLFPVLSIFFYYCYIGARLFLPQLLPFRNGVLAVSITFFYLIMGWNTFHTSLGAANIQWTPYTHADSVAFTYLRHNINDSDIIIFSKPRALTLYTNKRAMVLAPMKSYADNIQKAGQLNAKYVLIRKNLEDEYYNDFVKNLPHSTDSVVINSLYTLHIIR